MGSVVFKGQSVRPGKVVCVGKNYAAHIEEMASVPAENMVVFMKPATSIGTELFAALDEPLHYEGEICLLMQGGEVAGVGFGLDLTKRDTQAKLKTAGLPWERSKATPARHCSASLPQHPRTSLNSAWNWWSTMLCDKRAMSTSCFTRPT